MAALQAVPVLRDPLPLSLSWECHDCERGDRYEKQDNAAHFNLLRRMSKAC